jgi:hypothetical protein
MSEYTKSLEKKIHRRTPKGGICKAKYLDMEDQTGATKLPCRKNSELAFKLMTRRYKHWVTLRYVPIRRMQ